MGEIVSVFIRTLFFIIVLFFLTKLMGKKQLSQLNFFDYIVGITIGSIVADISLDLEKDFVEGIICLLSFLTIL